MFRIAVPSSFNNGADNAHHHHHLFAVSPQRQGPQYFLPNQHHHCPSQVMYVARNPIDATTSYNGCQYVRHCSPRHHHAQKRRTTDPRFAMLDHKLSMLENKLKENEEARNLLEKERSELVKKKECLMETKKHMQEQETKRAIEQKRLIKEHLERRRTKAWKEQQHKKRDETIQSPLSSNVHHFIRGEDGKLYQLVAVTPSTNKEKETGKANEKKQNNDKVTANVTTKEASTISKQEEAKPSSNVDEQKESTLSSTKNIQVQSSIATTVEQNETSSNVESMNGVSDDADADDEKIAKMWIFTGTTAKNAFLDDNNKSHDASLQSQENTSQSDTPSPKASETKHAEDDARSKCLEHSNEKEANDLVQHHVIDNDDEDDEAKATKHDGNHVIVEDVPADEWEEVESADVKDDDSSDKDNNSSLSSSQQTPNVSEGESWMEPVTASDI